MHEAIALDCDVMRFNPWFVTFTLLAATALTVEACSSTDASPVDDGSGGAEAGTPTKPGSDADGSVTAEEDSSTKTDATTDGGDAGCAPINVSLDGGGGCGTMDFGAAASPFTGVDAGGGNDYVGGAFAAGIYDAVLAERASASGGSWRETFVSDGAGHFTRIRQIDTGTGSGPGPVSRRSGTYAVNGKQITFTYDCAQTDGTPITTPGADTLPYEVVTDECNATYRYGVTGIRISLQRR
jgi:hypothetical protein